MLLVAVQLLLLLTGMLVLPQKAHCVLNRPRTLVTFTPVGVVEICAILSPWPAEYSVHVGTPGPLGSP